MTDFWKTVMKLRIAQKEVILRVFTLADKLRTEEERRQLWDAENRL